MADQQHGFKKAEELITSIVEKHTGQTPDQICQGGSDSGVIMDAVTLMHMLAETFSAGAAWREEHLPMSVYHHLIARINERN